LAGQGLIAMSSRTIELFRQHTEQQRHEAQAQEPRKHKSQAQERTQETDKPSLVAEMSRIEHEVRQLFDRASTDERSNIIRYLELVIRNLKRRPGND
jgi:hypothetical protein